MKAVYNGVKSPRYSNSIKIFRSECAKHWFIKLTIAPLISVGWEQFISANKLSRIIYKHCRLRNLSGMVLIAQYQWLECILHWSIKNLCLSIIIILFMHHITVDRARHSDLSLTVQNSCHWRGTQSWHPWPDLQKYSAMTEFTWTANSVKIKITYRTTERYSPDYPGWTQILMITEVSI